MSRSAKILMILVFTMISGQIFTQVELYRYRRSPKTFDIKLGGKLGYGRSWLSGDDFIVRSDMYGHDSERFTKFKGLNGYFAGGYVDLKFSDANYLQAEILIANKGWKQEVAFSYSPFVPVIEDHIIDNKVEVEYRILYLEFPVMYKVKIVNRFFGMIGPYFAVNILEKYKISNDFGLSLPEELTSSTKNNYFLNNNFGLKLGFMYQLKTGLNLSIEYEHGVTDIAEYYGITEVHTPEYHHVTTQFSIGYTFRYFNRFTNYKRRSRGLL